MTDSHSSPRRSPTWPLIPALLALAILLAATSLRTTHFADWPPGLSFDEGTNGLDAWRFISTGVFPFETIVGRPEPLYRVLVALIMALVGPTRFGLRLTSLYLGVLGVAAAYRAGRHIVSPGRPARRWTGLVAAGTLAVMVGHINLSRVGYRGIALMPTALLFFDAFLAAWETGRRRTFVAAGVWLGLAMMTYTSALVLAPLAALGLAHQGVVRLAARLRRRAGRGVDPAPFPYWPNVLAFGVAAIVAFSPMIVRYAVQPDLYGRVSELRERDEARSTRIEEQGGPRRSLADRLERSWRSVWDHNDKNPQYNVDSAPLLHTPYLYALALIGMAACLLRPRRLASWMALGMTGLMLLPVALGGQIPHGLRICGEYAALPLIVAASADPLLWLADQARRREVVSTRLGRTLLAAWGVVVTAVLVSGGMISARLYADYFTRDLRWGSNDEISAWTWFFETRRAAVAAAIMDTASVAYVPLEEANHPTLRYLTAAAYPRVQTFTEAFPPTEPLALPPGRFFIPYNNPDAATYAAFMPDGTVVLLPRFDERTLAYLRAAAGASGARLYDAHGELAATVVDFPADGRPILVDHPTGYPLDLSFGDQVRLVGWDGPEALPEAGEEIEITLYLTPGPARPQDAYLFAQLWTLDRDRLTSSLEELVLHWLFPPDRWRAGQIVPAVVRLAAPDGLDWGAYQVAVGLRDTRTRLLPVLAGDGTPLSEAMIPAGLVKVPRTILAPTGAFHRCNVDFGDQIGLMGYRIATPEGVPLDTLVPGEPLLLTLYWEALRRPDADYTIFVHVHDGNGSLVAQHDSQPEGGQYPTSVWTAGEVVSTNHLLTLPPDSQGPYLFFTGLYRWPSLERLPAQQDGRTTPDQRALLCAMP